MQGCQLNQTSLFFIFGFPVIPDFSSKKYYTFRFQGIIFEYFEKKF